MLTVAQNLWETLVSQTGALPACLHELIHAS